MTLEQVYYVSQIVSTAALVVSLVYLGLQTRLTARNQIAQMHQTRSQQLNDCTLRLTDENFSRLARAAFNAEPTLSDEQIHRFYFFASTVLRVFEEMFRTWRNGMLGDDRWATTQRTLHGILHAPGYRASYRAMRGSLDAEFVAMADDMMRAARGRPLIDPVADWRAAAADERATAGFLAS